MVFPLLILLLRGRTSSPKTIPCLKKLSPTQLAISALLLLNLAGLPPLGGFCLKAARLSILSPFYPLVSLILILSAVATLGFYINITLLSLITTFESLTPLNTVNNHSIHLVVATATIRAIALPALPLFLF